MSNITTITDPFGEVSVIIDNGDGSFTSMPKSNYDAQQAAQSTLPSNSSTPQAGA